MPKPDRTTFQLLAHRWLVPLISLLGTIAFFREYFARLVYIPFDLPSFHFPLADYAFLAIRHGRFPEWDPSNYGGMPFAANPQVALFYPGTWILFAFNWRREHLSYWSFEVFVLLHMWIAWMLCFYWLRGRRLGIFASACGSAIFACSGYMMMELQHLGVIVAYAWIPLGLMGIDEASEQDSWHPLWKTVAASALAFLGGYTPTWFVVAICFLSYALSRRFRWRLALGSCASIGVSLVLVMIQLLPAMRLSSLRVPEARYGLGYSDPAFYISYLIPNFYDFGPHVAVQANPGQEYLYLGVPGIVGLLLLLFFRRPTGSWSAAPLMGMLAVCSVLAVNPFYVVSTVVLRSTLFGQLCRDYYFLAGFTAAAAPLAAIGIDRFLARTGRSSRLLSVAVMIGLAIYSVRLLRTWRSSDFASGWSGATDVALLAALFFAGLFLLRAQRGVVGTALAAALLLAAAVDYKVHGTPKRFNGTLQHALPTDSMLGMNGDTYRELQANSIYRVALDQTGPLPADLRHYGLTTPQGFDPFLTTAYRDYLKSAGTFLSNWDYALDPANEQGIRTLGVGYFVSSEQGPQFAALNSNPKLRRLLPDDSFYKVFAVIDPRPPYGVEGEAANIERLDWKPEHRAFRVSAAAATKFYLSEQWNSGWSGLLDGKPINIERWNGAFQAMRIPAGRHQVDFKYQDEGLRIGAVISLATLLVLLAALRRSAVNDASS
jgi:Bacterial membrane protein YfhO